jgi:hypothetical protein
MNKTTNCMKRAATFFLTALLLAPLTAMAAAEEVPKFVAQQQAVQILAASAETPDRPYLAFPAVLDLGAEVLVSFKHGRLHAGDAGATLNWLRFDKASNRKLPQGTLAAVKGEIMQMGEWVRFPNGDIANYVDAHKPKVLRTGLAVVRSADRGLTFGPVQRVGLVEGVEYGYAFDAISRNGSTWMLVMTFANLPGGKLVYKYSSQPGSVDVIRSDDSGRTWHFVRSLTQELSGAPINESAFVPHGDGFIIASRGYDGRQWLLRADADFKLVAKTNLPAAHPFLQSMDRPRLFQRDGSFYLLGRNRVAQRATELALFKFSPDTLAITHHLVLDTANDQSPGDSFYAQPFWQERDGRTRFHIITYKRGAGPGLDIVRLEFKWEEVR